MSYMASYGVYLYIYWNIAKVQCKLSDGTYRDVSDITSISGSAPSMNKNIINTLLDLDLIYFTIKRCIINLKCDNVIVFT